MKRHTAEEIIPKLRQAEATSPKARPSPRSANAPPSASRPCTAGETNMAASQRAEVSDASKVQERCPRPDSAALRRDEDTSVTVDPNRTALATWSCPSLRGRRDRAFFDQSRGGAGCQPRAHGSGRSSP